MRLEYTPLGLEDAPYADSSTPWSLYLFDLQIFNKVELNVLATTLKAGYRVKGKKSNATAFVRSVDNKTVYLTQVSGEFQKDEALIINGTEKDSISITDITRYSAADAKSVTQDTSEVDSAFTTDFAADIRSYPNILRGFTPSDQFSITSSGNVTCSGRTFEDFKVNDIIVYQKPEEETVTYNKVTSIATNQKSAVVAAVTNVPDLASGALPSETIQVTVRIGQAKST